MFGTDAEAVIDKEGRSDHLRATGFYRDSHVEDVAKAAYERGLDVLVDKDMTEMLPLLLKRKIFRPSTYPSLKPERFFEGEPEALARFLHRRKNEPWLWQF